MIDDDPLVSVQVRKSLEGLDHRLYTASDSQTGLSEIVARRPDLVVLDNVLPDGLGVETLAKIHELAPEVPILFITARGSGGTAIEAMKLSAFDYLPKPIEPPKLRGVIDRALAMRELARTDTEQPSSSGPNEPVTGELLVGECPAMQAVFKAIGKVAMQDVAVLIRGEHGAGKETVAHEIHRHSRRADQALVKLHCRGLDEQRLEAELFGQGDTGGGRIEQAAGGTLILQEVAGLSLPLQAKLLRAVRDGQYEPAGGAEERPVRCRFIAISTEDLESLSRSGAFRSDLFYALSSFVITLPPLRQRHGDLPLLIQRSLQKLQPIAESYGVRWPRISDDAMKALSKHVWPGNIDELESVLKRALVEQKGNILLKNELFGPESGSVVPITKGGPQAKYLTDWSAFAELRIDAGADTLHADATAEMEQKLFSRVLRHTQGNQARAARILGITRASLRKKLRAYGMAPKPTED